MTLTEQMTALAKQAKAASRDLAKLTTAEKNSCLLAMADALENNAAALKQANALDMEAGAKMSLTSAMLDRLKLDDQRIAVMAEGLREVAALPDPVGEVLRQISKPVVVAGELLAQLSVIEVVFGLVADRFVGP